MNAKAKQDAYERVTETIVAKLEEGMVPWHKPWSVDENGQFSLPMSMSTKRAYRGVNVFLLGMQGYTSPWWGTFKQIQERGGKVLKGEHGTHVIYWSRFEVLDGRAVKKSERAKLSQADLERIEARFSLRTFVVFNAEQCEGLENLVPADERDERDPESIEVCESVASNYFETSGPGLRHMGSVACYNPSSDVVKMPKRGDFDTIEHYYTTLFHEAVHSTGHETRLARKEAFGNGFGTERYSKEELVAEMGAAMLAAVTGIGHETLNNSASYVQGWLKAIKGDTKLVVQAAAQAQKAADLILGTTFESKEVD